MQAVRASWMVLALLVSLVGVAAGQSTSELRNGRWVDIPTPTTTQQAIDPGLLKIEQLLEDKEFSAARKASIAWLLANKTSPQRPRGLFLTADALYNEGERTKSFYYLDELLDTYPDSPLYPQALEKQYTIADAYLNGFKPKFLGMRLFGAEDEAVEMLFRIQGRSPKSPIAERSLLRTADYYYSDAQYDLAEDAYRAYMEDYPRSPYVPRVMLRRAYSSLAQFRGLRFDATPVIDAKAQLQDIVSLYPDLAAQENLPAVIERIDKTFARKLAITADFYRRTHVPRAEAYTYQYLVEHYPSSEDAGKARDALVQLHAAGYGKPTTLPGRTAAPTTNPVQPVLRP